MCDFYRPPCTMSQFLNCRPLRNIREAQLMLTNPRNAFRGQSRSLNIVPFHMLGILSSCAIVTLSLFDFKKCRDHEIWVRGHSMSLKVAPLEKLCMVSYQCSLVTLSLKRIVFEIFDFKTAVTLKMGLWVRLGHCKCRHSIERMTSY